MNIDKTEYEFIQIEEELKIIELLEKIILIQPLDSIQTRAAASSLHSIYNGIEKILIFQLQNKNISIPKTSNWHTDLIELCKNQNIINEELFSSIRRYMSFRHFFRHTYGFILDFQLLKPLIMGISELVSNLKIHFNY